MKISIITAVFNNAQHIGSCLESVRSQTWPGIEHIIIDGGSTDGTLEVIKTGNGSEVIGKRKNTAEGSEVIGLTNEVRGNRQEVIGSNHQSPITHDLSPVTRLISEPDNGIYDALNKGIRLATGDVIGFLHADDIYADETVIEKMAKAMAENNADSCYGDLEYVKDNGNRSGGTDKEVKRSRGQEDRLTSLQADKLTGEKDKRIRGQESSDRSTQNSELITHNFKTVRYWKSGPFEKGLFKKGWMPPHPTFFVRREVYRRLGAFDTGFRIAADYELMLRFLWKNDISTRYIPEVLIKMRTGGASNGSLRNILKKSAEDYRAMRMHGLGGLATLVRKNISKIPQFFEKTGNR